MLSVNTNTGAMVALQYLNDTQAQLATTQNAVDTGLKVSSAKDDGAVYAIAQNMRGDIAGYTAVTDSLNRGMSAIDVAMSAGQSISDLLIEMKTKALAASDTSLDTASRAAMNQDFVALRDQITTIVKNAVFNGYNLVDGSTQLITALASADGTRRITASAENLSLSGAIVTIKTTATISTQSKASTMVSVLQASLQNVNAALAKLSAGLRLQALRHADHWRGQPGRCRHGKGKRASPVAAGQAAARRPGALHRQPVAAVFAVVVQVETGGTRRKTSASAPHSLIRH